MLNVSHKLAKANQVKTKDAMLYCSPSLAIEADVRLKGTHESLDVEEEHADDAMARLIKPVEVDEGVLLRGSSDQTTMRRRKCAANSPLRQRKNH